MTGCSPVGWHKESNSLICILLFFITVIFISTGETLGKITGRTLGKLSVVLFWNFVFSLLTSVVFWYTFTSSSKGIKDVVFKIKAEISQSKKQEMKRRISFKNKTSHFSFISFLFLFLIFLLIFLPTKFSVCFLRFLEYCETTENWKLVVFLRWSLTTFFHSTLPSHFRFPFLRCSSRLNF